MRPLALSLLLALSTLTPATGVAAQVSLVGGRGSLDRQNMAAHAHDYSYLRTGAQVERFVEAGYLVPVVPDEFEFGNVSFPYARPEVQLFLSRLGRQYRKACSEDLVVTSLTRPDSRQPRNASTRSVHPTGMAIDLRKSHSRDCRTWLEKVLLSLEGSGILEATRERWPPHYHIALFPTAYTDYVERVTGQAVALVQSLKYEVREGDNLWTLARRYNTTIDAIQEANRLRRSVIYPGQELTIPAAR